MPRLTHYPHSVRSKRPGTIVDVPWDGLAEYLESCATDARSKGGSGYWVAAACTGPHADAGCEPTDVVALDWEGSDPALPGLDFVAHTSDTHRVVAQNNPRGEPRWRVWVRLDTPHTADELRRIQLPWPDAKLRAISQPAFVPTMGEDTWWLTQTGGAWAPRLSEPEPPTPAQPPPPRGSRISPSPRAINALVTRWLSNPDGTNRLAGATGACLAEWGWSDAEVEAFLGAWLHADPRLPKHTDDALRGAAKRRAGDRIVGFPTLVAELGGEWAAEQAEAVDITALLEADASAAGAERPSRLGSAEPPFHWATGDQMLDYQLPEIQWLVEALSFAPGAPGLCTGYSGTGKTTTLQDLALSVATPGRRFLNHFEVRHGRVAHIDLEQGTQQTVRTYRALGLERGAELVCSVLPSWRLTDADSIKALAREARGRALIIIDSFRVACLGVDENSSDFAEPLGVLGQISEATGCAFMLNHHSGKGHQDTPHMSARGSSAITAAVSVHWSFERKPLTPDVRPCLQIVKSRNHQTPAMVWQSWVEMVAGASAGQFSLHARANAGAEVEDPGLQAEIIDALDSGPLRNIAELATTIGKRKKDVAVAAKQLGVVTRGGILVVVPPGSGRGNQNNETA